MKQKSFNRNKIIIGFLVIVFFTSLLVVMIYSDYFNIYAFLLGALLSHIGISLWNKYSTKVEKTNEDDILSSPANNSIHIYHILYESLSVDSYVFYLDDDGSIVLKNRQVLHITDDDRYKTTKTILKNGTNDQVDYLIKTPLDMADVVKILNTITSYKNNPTKCKRISQDHRIGDFFTIKTFLSKC